MKRDLALGRVAAMLEQEDTLPGAEGGAAALHRNGQLRVGQSGPQVCGHIVRAFIVMLIGIALRSDPLEVPLEVAPRGRSRILLDYERRRSVAAKQRQQALGNARSGGPIGNFISDIEQSATGSAHTDSARLLPHAGSPLADLRQASQIA